MKSLSYHMYFNNSDFTWPYVKFESQIGHKNLNSRLNLSGTWVRVKIHSTQQGHEGWLNFEMVCGGLGKQTPDLSLGVECRCEMDRLSMATFLVLFLQSRTAWQLRNHSRWPFYT